MTTYTVYRSDDSGKATQRLTLEEAAQRLLTIDGHHYEIRQDGTLSDGTPWFRLFLSLFSRNSPLGGRPLVPSRFAATSHAEIYEQVITEEWHGLEAIPDADFDANMAEALADSEDQPNQP